MRDLLSAIVDNNLAKVTALLKAQPNLARSQLRVDQLYRSGICHWLYVGDTALHLASAGYRCEIVRRLLEAGADPNAAGNRRISRPLHYASDGYINGPAWDPERQVRTIRILLEAGADINAPDKNGATPLHRAVRTRCAAAVKCLLDSGGDPTRPNKSGSKPYDLALVNSGRGGSGAPEAKAAQREIIEIFRELHRGGPSA